MEELASLTGGASTSANPMSSALDSIKKISGGDAAPSSATQGTYAGSLTLNAGVNMGNGVDDWTVLGAVAILAVAYVFINHK